MVCDVRPRYVVNIKDKGMIAILASRYIGNCVYAKDKLLRTILATYKIARGRTCRAILVSNSKKPPPAIPPVPLETSLPTAPVRELLFEALNPCDGDDCTGCVGATIAESPAPFKIGPSSCVRFAMTIRRKCVKRSWKSVVARGYGNLYTPAMYSQHHSL